MLDHGLSISSSKIKVLRQFYRRSFEVKRQPFRDRSFILDDDDDDDDDDNDEGEDDDMYDRQ